MGQTKRFIFLLLIVNLSVLLANAWGNEPQWVPKITIKKEYTDNINFSAADREGDWIFTLSPSICLQDVTIKNSLNAEIKMDFIEYSQKDELDTINQQYRLSYDIQGTKLLKVHFLGSFQSDTTLDSEREEKGIFFSRTGRKKYNLKPSLLWAITLKTNLELAFDNEKVCYDDTNNYSNFQKHDSTVHLFHNLWNERFVLSWQTTYSRYSFDSSTINQVDSYHTLLGAEHQFTKALKIITQTGIRYTKMQFFSQKDDINRRAFGLLSFTYRYAKGFVGLTFNRDIYSSGLYGEIIEQDKVILWAKHNITNFFVGRLKLRWNNCKSENDFWNTDKEYYYLSSSFSYRLMKKAFIYFGYTHDGTYNRSKDDNQKTNKKGKRNTIFLQFSAYWEKG